MRILQVITSLRTGGAENLVTEIVPRLRDKGHDVDVLLHDGAETPFRKKLEDAGIKIISLGENNNVYDPRFIFKMMPIIKQYDIVHTHNTASQMLVAIAAFLSRANCILVTTEHNTDNRRRHLWWFKPMDQWMYRQYCAIISISKTATELMLQYLGNDIQITTIPNGIDCMKYRNAKPLSNVRSEEDIIIVMVAAFRPQKQQEVLIRSLQHLPENYIVWLVGDGVRRAECENIAKHLGLETRVKFWGVRSDIPSILQTADVLVMSTHYEGMSLSNIEGMASGKPFIASDVNGVREITEGAGILFREGDDVQLAEEIKRVTTDNDYQNLVIEQCLKRAAKFDINNTISAYNNLYINI